MMIFAFMLAHRNFAENVSWKRVKNALRKAVLRRNALEMLIGFVSFSFSSSNENDGRGRFTGCCWSSNFSLSEKTG